MSAAHRDEASDETADSKPPTDQTVMFTPPSARGGEARPAAVAHFLVPVDAPEQSVRVGAMPLAIGRSHDARLQLDDRAVSGRHCIVRLRSGDVWVQDLGSTNGTLVDGRRIAEPTLVPVGSTLQIGPVQIRHELRDEQAVADEAELSGELKAAAQYVTELLPEPWLTGPLKIQWRLVPSRQLGGDSLGYAALEDGRTAIYLIDVCGHGLRAALHSVSILNAVRQRSIAGDWGDPGAVLTRLNRAFPMEEHAGMFFTIWYGVLDPASRRLQYASAGHPPAIVRTRDGAELWRLEMRRPPIGTREDVVYKSQEVVLPPDSLLYVFSDGVYEEPGLQKEAEEEEGRKAGLLGMAWLEKVIQQQRGEGHDEPERIEAALRAATGLSRFEDDVTLLVAHVP